MYLYLPLAQYELHPSLFSNVTVKASVSCGQILLLSQTTTHKTPSHTNIRSIFNKYRTTSTLHHHPENTTAMEPTYPLRLSTGCSLSTTTATLCAPTAWYSADRMTAAPCVLRAPSSLTVAGLLRTPPLVAVAWTPQYQQPVVVRPRRVLPLLPPTRG